jgi:hypothetical protein
MLVENGPAVGASRAHELPADSVVISSEQSVSVAKNTGLAEIKRHGGGFTAVFDDDDWYSADYLSEAVGYACSYDFVGKNRHLVLSDDEFWLCQQHLQNRPTRFLTGGTISCWAEDSPEYPNVPYGEDMQYCEALNREGAVLWATSVYHYCYVRSSSREHTWKISTGNLKHMPFAYNAIVLGGFDSEIASGKRGVESYKVLNRDRDWKTASERPRGEIK